MRHLQARGLKAVQQISILENVLVDARANVDQQFHMLHQNASQVAKQYNIVVKTPRRCTRQTGRDNHPSENAEEYYRQTLAIPFLDHLIKERFTCHTVTALKCFASCFNSDLKASDAELIFFFKG